MARDYICTINLRTQRNSGSVRSRAQTVNISADSVQPVETMYLSLTDHSAGSYKPQTLYIIYFLWSKVHSTWLWLKRIKGRLAPKKKTFFFVSNDTGNFLKKSLSLWKYTLYAHPDHRENFKWGPWGAVYVTSQGDSTLIFYGKAIVSALWIDHKKTRRMASAKCSGATTGFSSLALARPADEVSQEKGRPFNTVGLKCCTAIPENANTCAANTYRLALLIVIQSYLQNRGRGSVKG